MHTVTWICPFCKQHKASIQDSRFLPYKGQIVRKCSECCKHDPLYLKGWGSAMEVVEQLLSHLPAGSEPLRQAFMDIRKPGTSEKMVQARLDKLFSTLQERE